MKAEELDEHIKAGKSILLIDVRSSLEFKDGHISGAIHAPMANLLKTVGSSAQSKKDLLLLTCEHGPRAQVARIFLKLKGYKNIELLDGHMAFWRNSGRPVQKH
jgi:hydroxyacylglutathione hydrolase